MNDQFPHLFQPLKVKNIVFKNRIEASPMGNVPSHHFISSFPDYGGVMFYDKSIGGAGALHVVSHGLDSSNSYISNGHDPFEKYQRDITQEQLSVGKQAGAVTSLVLGINSVWNDQLMGPSALEVFGKKYQELPKELIAPMIEDLAKKAVKCKEFGFDELMLDIAHDSIVAQFMAPSYNHRTDEYGGSYENRFRFAHELIHRVREAVGNDFVIELRLSAVLHVPGSYEFEEMVRFIQTIENEIDIVNVASGMDDNRLGNVNAVAMCFLPHNKNVAYAEEIKKQCNVIVSVGGSIMSAKEGEEILANGSADMIMYGRALIADPFLPNKAKAGKSEDIVPCLRCNYCYHVATDHYQTVCSVNPRFYREKRVPLKLEKAEIQKKVAVIGAGPAGCMAALTAFKRGHEVDLYEKSDEVGGQLKCADYGGIHKQDLKRYKDYLKIQIEKSGVHFYPRTAAVPEILTDKGYDVVIVAIGAKPIDLPIAAIKEPVVSNFDYAMKHIDELGEHVVIIGGGTDGMELAVQLADLNKKIDVIEKSSQIAGSANMLYKYALDQELKNIHVNVHLNTCVKEINDKHVLVEKTDKSIDAIPYDNVVYAVGMKSKAEEAMTFSDTAEEVYYIGDCKKVAKVLEAVNEAYFIASNL